MSQNVFRRSIFLTKDIIISIVNICLNIDHMKKILKFNLAVNY